MAVEPPLNHLVLGASSVSDDMGFVALVDVQDALRAVETKHRVIGGHMVMSLVQRWQLGRELERQTGDADLGIPPLAVQTPAIIDRLVEIGYVRRTGNRFAKEDGGARSKDGAAGTAESVIDILVPGYTSRRRDRTFGDPPHLWTIEVPGLATAFKRKPIDMTLEMHRLDGEVLVAEISIPDEVAAIVLKAFATQVRTKGTDISDVWRCLEIARAAGCGPHEFEAGESAEAASIVRSLFAGRNGEGMEAIVEEQRLSSRAGDERHTRLKALIARVLGD